MLADVLRIQDTRARQKRLELVCEVDPDVPDAHVNLGSALVHDELEEALACYRKALQLQPDHALAHCNLGQALRFQGKFREALAELQRAAAVWALQQGEKIP